MQQPERMEETHPRACPDITMSIYTEYFQKILNGRESSMRVCMPPEMLTKELRVTTSEGTDELTPAEGKKLRVWGIWACCTITGNLTSTLRATLAFGTGHTTDSSKILSSHRCGKGDVSHCVTMTGINVVGATDEVLRLTNLTYSLGTVIYRTIVYYTEE